jgi:hypothetical protein
VNRPVPPAAVLVAAVMTERGYPATVPTEDDPKEMAR